MKEIVFKITAGGNRMTDTNEKTGIQRRKSKTQILQRKKNTPQSLASAKCRAATTRTQPFACSFPSRRVPSNCIMQSQARICRRIPS